MHGGGLRAILYTLRKAQSVGFLRMWNAMRSKNTCKTCALGMGGQHGGMRNEKNRFPEVCKKSVQAMAADLQGAIHEYFFEDFSLHQLQGFTSRELEAAGRIVDPVIAGPLDSHYRKTSWEDAIDRIAKKLNKIKPSEAFFYVSGRSCNEAGFLLQLFARMWGTNNVSNCSYYCHQASGVGLTTVTGSGTATVTLDDLEKCDLIFLIGANPASNHPRFMSNLVELKRRGGKVIVINPLKEAGLVKFRVPSDPRSLLFGSHIADEYIQPHIGGDIALLSGIAKSVIERGAANENFLSLYADGWEEFQSHLQSMKWIDIEQQSGIKRRIIERIATIFASSSNTIFCWAMGITHHEHGVENVQSIANLAILRGMIGAPGRGLLPLRGHSNVQGMGSMGVTPKLKPVLRQGIKKELNVTIPRTKGLDTLESIERAHDGKVKVAFCLGGNLYGSSPDANYAAEAFSKCDLVVYLNTTLNTGHAWGRGKETIILPVLARDEEPQPTTQESMFNFVRLSDGGPARHVGPRSEVDVIASLAQATLGSESTIEWDAMRNREHVRKLIARIIPGFEAIGNIGSTKREFHIKGRILHEPKFATKSGKVHMHVIPLPKFPPLNGELRLMTVRSEGQFNTVVYEEEDIYRGQTQRDVIMMNERDIERLAIRENQRVDVESEVGLLENVLVRMIDIAPGNCVMYYPEANVLIPRAADPQSRTPAFKHTVVSIQPSAFSGQPGNNGQRMDLRSVTEEARSKQRESLKAC